MIPVAFCTFHCWRSIKIGCISFLTLNDLKERTNPNFALEIPAYQSKLDALVQSEIMMLEDAIIGFPVTEFRCLLTRHLPSVHMKSLMINSPWKVKCAS